MKLCEELNNRSKVRFSLLEKVNRFAEYEKEDLFMILRKEADKGKNYCVIYDYILTFPYLVNKKMFEEVLSNEGLSYEYVDNKESGTIDCIVKW